MYSLKPLALGAALLMLLTACAPGQAPETSPAPEPESPSSVSAPAPEPEAEPEPSQPESSEPEPQSESEPEPSQPEEPSSDPNGRQENPDTAFMYTPEQEQEIARAVARGTALEKELEAAMPKEIYSSFHVFCQKNVELQIRTNDEKALDEFLASWQGTKWDELEKIPVDHSRAEAEALAKKIADYGYDFGPGAVCEAFEDSGSVWVSVDFAKNEDVIFSLPEELARLAEEAGLSEIVRYNASVNGFRPNGPTTPGVNPDT